MLLLLSTALAADSASLRSGLDDPNGWVEVGRKSVKDIGEVVIRYKDVAGQSCLEGTGAAAADPDALLKAASDINSQPGWSTWEIPISVRIGTDPTAFDYYQLLDNPSPVADRFWFLHAKVSRQGDDRLFAWEQVDAAARYPQQLADVKSRFPDAVQTSVNVGDWTFTPSGSTTRIRYRICTDAGGSLPRWVGEYAARTTLPTNLGDIVRAVRGR